MRVLKLSKNATEEHLREFFSFCGDVDSIEISPSTSDTTTTATKQNTAIVTFTDPASVITALLLSDAIIVDSSISIVEFNADVPVDRGVDPDDTIADTAQTKLVPKKTATEVIAGLIVAGYFRGDQLIKEVKKRAKEFDEKNQLSTKVAQAQKWAQTQFDQLDHTYRVKQKAGFASFLLEKAQTAASGSLNKTVQAAKDGASKFSTKPPTSPTSPTSPNPNGSSPQETEETEKEAAPVPPPVPSQPPPPAEQAGPQPGQAVELD